MCLCTYLPKTCLPARAGIRTSATIFKKLNLKMMKKKDANLREHRMEFRITASAKNKLKSTSDEYELTMATILDKLIEGMPVDNIKERHFQFMAVNNLAREINYIGKNINQITVAIRQISSDKKIEDGEIQMLKEIMETYLIRLPEVKAVILEKF